MHPNVIVKRSKRRTVSLSVTKELEILVKAPMKMTDTEIGRFVEKYDKWIEKHLLMQNEKNEKAKSLIFSDEEVRMLKERARNTVMERVRHFGGLMRVEPTSVKITSAVTRWGSCSGKNSLCFSYRIILLPPELIDYIVVHELSHIRVKNHSRGFYLEVGKYLPDYKNRINGLKAAQKELGI